MYRGGGGLVGQSGRGGSGSGLAGAVGGMQRGGGGVARGFDSGKSFDLNICINVILLLCGVLNGILCKMCSRDH